MIKIMFSNDFKKFMVLIFILMVIVSPIAYLGLPVVFDYYRESSESDGVTETLSFIFWLAGLTSIMLIAFAVLAIKDYTKEKIVKKK